jgi:cytoskeletal protein CcmA (bactofilin family)
MKTMFKITTLLILVIVIGSGKPGLAIEKTKRFSEKWPAASIETLKVINKFGEVKFVNEGGSDITVEVKVTVESPNERKADEMLDRINVTFSKSGTTAKAETEMSSNYNFNGKFSIDYVVNIPSDKNLDVSNKYGNVVVNRLTGNGDFDVQYGNISAVSLTGKITVLNLAYGKGNINETGDLTTDISYSNITIGSTGNLKLNSKYSGIDLDKAAAINTDSRYDKFNFGEIISLTADTKYTQIKIGKLTKSLLINSGYGGVRVDKIAPDFESINVTNSYGQVALGLSNLNYMVDAECSYCGISYPQEKFKGNRMKENTSIRIQGNIGTAEGGKVMVKSRYGEIKLGE